MPHYVQSDGPSIQERGREAVKEPHPVFLMESDVPFSVSTNEGTLNGNAGDYVAYDPISGHVWPVSADYLDMHYVWVDEGELGDTLSERAATREKELQDKLSLEQQARAELETEANELRNQLHEAETKLTEAETQLAASQTAESVEPADSEG